MQRGFMLLLLAVCWSTAFPFTGFLSETQGLSPLLIAYSRIVCGALFMLVALLLMRQPLPTRLRDWLVLVAIGLSGNVLPFMLVAWGQREVDSGVTAVLIAMVPLFIVVMAHYFTRDERLTRMKALAVLVAFAGACVIALPSALGQFTAPLTAYLAIGLATLCYAITGQLVYTVRHLPPLSQSSAALLMAALVMTPLVALSGPELWQGSSAIDWAVFAYLGLISTGLASWLLAVAVGRYGPSSIVVSNYLVPVLGLVLGFFLRGDRLESIQVGEVSLPVQAIGVALVFLGLLLVAVAQRRA